ncbi:MAG TPA: DUF2017 family protein [Actinomycetota bacterium]|nr:DUF2017 family protein [Actinomycetota bacterium]
MPSFQKVAGEGIRMHLDQDEARLLRELLKEMKLLLEADIPQTDAVKERLFPAAYEDTQRAEEFREMVGGDLMQGKLAALHSVSERVGRKGPLETSIPEDEVTAWLTLLTDLRLAIGTRLEVDDETMEHEIDPNDPRAPALSVLHWLGWVQGSILEVLDGDYYQQGEEGAAGTGQ